MKATRSRGSRLARSFRGLGMRILLGVFIFLSLALLLVSQLQPRFLERGRAMAVDGAAPILDLLAVPVDAFDSFLAWTENVVFVFRENERLRVENDRLKEWHLAAQYLAVENTRLRALLDVKDITAEPVATGRVIGQSSGNFVRSVVIDVGEADGVQRNHMVLDADGVVGRIISTGARSSRVLLLNDLNSRIPVRILPADVNAILIGNNNDYPSLIFMPRGTTVNVGDWVVTSGHGGIFQPDLPVGQITATPVGADPRVELRADMARLNFLRVYAYDAALPGEPAATAPDAEGEAP